MEITLSMREGKEPSIIIVNSGNTIFLEGKFLEMKQKGGGITEKRGKGTPQGGVISPLLANLFLHYVLDK